MRIRNWLGILVLLVSASWLFGQAGVVGTIVGTVTDNTGAVVANANVELTNTATNQTVKVTSSGSGDFTASNMQPGSYKITVQASGFNRSVADNVILAVAQTERVNFSLKPGSVSETVEVQASAVALDTDTSAVSQVVTQQQVDQLPLNGRNFLNLLFIGAGAVQTTGEQGQFRGGEGNAISINGARPTSNNYTLDGITNTDTAVNTPALILSQDAIQEFRVQSETYSAEFGFAANQVNIISKSGTNALHGTGWDFLRNDALDAKAPFQTTIPKLRQNQFGFVVGGPIYIPKVYDGRNKTFFLVNYEGWRITNGVSGNTFNVPDPAQLAGDFSASGLSAITSAGGTCTPGSSSACLPIDPLTGLPFPGNIIPSSRFSRLAQVFTSAKLIPGPNQTGDNNYLLRTNLANTVNQTTYKLDQSFGKFGSISGRYSAGTYNNQNINGSVSIPFGVGAFNQKTESWALSHTINIGSHLINNFRFGRLEPITIQGGTAAPQSDVDALGFSGTFTNLPSYARLYPGVGFQGINNTSFGSQGNDTTTSDGPTWQFGDTVSFTHGRHTLAVGIEFRRWSQIRNLSSDFLGSFSFNNDLILHNGSATGFGGETANGCATVTCGTGNSIADFLLGYYNGVSTFQPGPFSAPGVAGNPNQYQYKYFAPFIQDDWKVNSRLTLNLGLRWDYRTIPVEAKDKLFWFDTQNPGGGLCFADKALQTQSVTGLGGPIAPEGNGFYRYCGRRNPTANSKYPYAPRLGFAWRPFGEKTVVRGGYGIFFDAGEDREIDDSGDIYPFVVRANVSPISDPTAPKSSDNLFPPVSLHQVSAATDGGQFFAVIISERPRNQYVQQWTLSLQRELARNTTLEINYVGNKGTHLLNRTNIGQPLPVKSIAFCNAKDSDGNFINLTKGDCPNSARRPYSNITQFLGFLDSEWNGYSNYNAANIKIEHRTKDLAFLAVYTWAKSLDDKSAAAGVGATNSFSGHVNDRNQRFDYGRSDYDVNHRFVLSSVYQLPVGKGRRYLGNANRLADLAVGGWQLTTIATFQKGFPFSVQSPDPSLSNVAFNNRANQTCSNPNSGFNKSNQQYFNTSCFGLTQFGEFGNSGRNIFRGPGINNWDIGLGKTFQFTEKLGLQTRIETFNSFNHSQYGIDPATSFGIGSPVGNSLGDPSNLGKVLAARPGRVVQLGAKIVF